MKKLGLKVLINTCLLAVLTFSLFSSSPAKAISQYDMAVQLADSLTLSRSNSNEHPPQVVTTTWGSLMFDCANWSYTLNAYNNQDCNYYKNIFNGVLNSGVGWAVSQFTAKTSFGIGHGSYIAGDKFVRLAFSSGPSSRGEFSSQYSSAYGEHLDFKVDGVTCLLTLALPNRGDTTRNGPVVNSAACAGLPAQMSNDGGGSLYSIQSFFFNAPITYPSGYEGIEAPSSSEWADLDGDGLIAEQETTQGTSNANKDTDGDGLDDYIESQWYPDRDEVFCGPQCAYPDPTTKDVYVEIDWMNNPNDTSYQPSSTQLNQVKSAFNARGINAHFDTGQYGGGNELSSYEQTLPFVQDANNFDFYDYKNGTSTTNANFDSDRKRIWHYMISGYQYAENTGSSGVSFAGDDDFFISYGLIKNGQSSFGYLNLDDAVAGTIIHELGHSLCLTDTAAYNEQSSNCVYDGIDNTNASSDYVSSMNYSYQMFMVDYSMGQNGTPNDHDDWGAVETGLKDFSNTDRDAGDIMSGKTKMEKLIQGISIDQAKDLRKKSKLGKHNMNYFTRQLQMPMR